MILGKHDKQPAEVKDYPIDYSEWLSEIPAGDTLASAIAVATCTTTPADTALVVDQVIVSPIGVAVWLSAGTDGETYKVTVTATTVGGRVDQSEITVRVKDT
ncbi:hypothetical protein [Polaromonas sp.]|uniref:phage fiber-tail adaptor protein n=1 Tax=Polaromonas sp. TaxID=1869339 RepID=UPI0032669552